MAFVTRNPSHLRPPIRRRLLLHGAINRSIAFLPRKSTLWEAVAAQEEALPEMADLHTEPRILPHQPRWLCHQCRPITSRLPLLIGPTQEQAHNPSSWRRVPHTHRRLILRMKMTLLVRSPPSLSAMPPGSSSCSSLPATSFTVKFSGVRHRLQHPRAETP